MAISMKDLGIDQLTPEDRLNLVHEIWESLSAESDPFPLTESQQSDLQRRLAEYEHDPKRGSTWEEVKARLSAKS